MRVLVTGAGGFVGGALAERLAARGDVELARSIRRPTAMMGDACVLELGDAAGMRCALATLRPDIVVHAAGRTHGPDASLDADNRLATRTLAEGVAEASPGAGLILLGSAAQYGRFERRTPWRETDPCAPVDAYGASKLAAEAAAFEIAAATGLRVAALRVFNIVAPGPQGPQVFASFLRKAAVSPERVEMGPLDAVRDFVALADVLTAVERTIERDAWGEPINVCTGVGRTTRALIEATAGEIGVRVVEAEGPAPALDWSVGDPARCAARLGFVPTSDLTPVIREAAAWVKGGADARSRA
jgi:nucleoside-diphosphate-sugar epimerase